MTSATYRVRLRYPPHFSALRGEWRLLVRSLRPELVGPHNYEVYVDAERRPDLDARCTGLRLGFVEGLTLLVEVARRPRTFGDLTSGNRRDVPYASALLVLPGDVPWDDDTVFSVWAEWRSLLSRFPELPAAEGAETIAEIYAGVDDTVTAARVEALINHNHAPA